MERWIPYFQDLIECSKLLDKHSSIEGSEQPASAVSTSAPPQPLGCCLGNFCHPQRLWRTLSGKQRTMRTSHSQGSERPIDILEQHFSFKSYFVLQKFLTPSAKLRRFSESHCFLACTPHWIQWWILRRPGIPPSQPRKLAFLSRWRAWRPICPSRAAGHVACHLRLKT